jgi:hypothetical protein
MTKINALPRPAGATVLSLLAIALAALVLPASSFAAPLPEGSDPVLTISPSPAVVPTTTVNNQSALVDFVLQNAGGEDAAVEKVFLEGEDATEFSFGGSNCGNLQPGNQCSASVGFKPSSLGEKRTTLHVSFAGGRPEQSFEISGTSVEPQLTFSPASYDFGLQRVYESRNFSLQLTNSGEANVQVSNFEIAGGSGSFWANNNSDCWGHSLLAPGESCWIEVYFSPQDALEYEAELRAISNGHAFTASLSGQGGRAIIDATPNPADFGAVTVGAESEVRTITVTNSGNIPAGFFIGIVAGGDSGSFQLLSENCTGAELMPSSSCTARVRFRPQDAGAKAAYMAFFGDNDGGAMVGLKGEGVAPAVTLAPLAFDFGFQAAGGKSDSHDFAVRNDGTTPLDLSGVSIAGADLDQFALAGDECTGETLAPGTECLVRVRFAPDSGGAKAAKLRIASKAGTFLATLSGTGTGTGTGEGVVAGAVGHRNGAFGHPDSPPPPRPERKARRPRFVRGETIRAGKLERPRRVHGRASAVPR